VDTGAVSGCEYADRERSQPGTGCCFRDGDSVTGFRFGATFYRCDPS
jgi:hypothetical protein